ncbi:response regulator [Massilia sp. YIM B02769]|uniref:response regulator n=1 Tax=unclassified Massilia TaxID=2609279 RepID=UPI0025B65795|nr:MULTISPECIES: response regulator [unclassified Massilia]MDN4060252.1 response regulator [Massilia sp. YIM B02769]
MSGAVGNAMQDQALVLIAEDDDEIAAILAAYCARGGFRTLRAENGQRTLDLHLSARPDLVLLDVQMPVLDGWMVLAELRRRGDTPVIMVTAMDGDIDKLMGLRTGADDYVVKPFNPAEVVARVQAVLRRTSRQPGAAPDVIRAAQLAIDLGKHEASAQLDGRELALPLTLTEFRLLAHLARAPRKVFSRSELLTHCLPEGDTLERTVDSHISKLRRKLEDAGVTGIPENVRGVGYRFGGAA